jgi:nitrogen fixation protein FixH
VVLETLAVPAEAAITAEAERPLGAREAARLTFAPQGQGRWLSNETLVAGRWQIHIGIRAGAQEWAGESNLR